MMIPGPLPHLLGKLIELERQVHLVLPDRLQGKNNTANEVPLILIKILGGQLMPLQQIDVSCDLIVLCIGGFKQIIKSHHYRRHEIETFFTFRRGSGTTGPFCFVISGWLTVTQPFLPTDVASVFRKVEYEAVTRFWFVSSNAPKVHAQAKICDPQPVGSEAYQVVTAPAVFLKSCLFFAQIVSPRGIPLSVGYSLSIYPRQPHCRLMSLFQNIHLNLLSLWISIDAKIVCNRN